ncbi:hypothetical protein C1645_817457 [Glomus cerebriforme]|uniref:Uncharacterized protein n=1 Tax=Glomus cerebriforme TaxID=658196 RepID=A0A397TD22_9GLOM|nr:hypothetical protein C1645_817457 [Glomus cerebriforme]
MHNAPPTTDELICRCLSNVYLICNKYNNLLYNFNNTAVTTSANNVGSTAITTLADDIGDTTTILTDDVSSTTTISANDFGGSAVIPDTAAISTDNDTAAIIFKIFILINYIIFYIY